MMRYIAFLTIALVLTAAVSWSDTFTSALRAIGSAGAIQTSNGLGRLADSGLTAFGGALTVPTKINLPSVTAFPGSPTTGDVVIVTDDSAAGACDSAAGSAVTICRWNGAAWTKLGDGDATPTLDQAFDSGKVIDGANSLANAVRIGDGVTPICLYTDATLGPQVRPCTDADVKTIIPTNFNWSLYDIEGAASMLTVDPDASTVNGKYQFGTNYKPVMSMLLPLEPRGAATQAAESIVTNQPKAYYLTVTDVDTDAGDFSFPVTAKMVGATTATFRLIGVSKNASPSGNIVFTCAAKKYTPGTDTFAAHSTTGEVTLTLTPATQNRPVAVTSSAHTLNGTLAAGDVVYGSCEVSATGTTSAQMTDFRLWANVLVQLSANSWSD